MVSMPHPRTKGSTGFPDAIRTCRRSRIGSITVSVFAGASAQIFRRSVCASTGPAIARRYEQLVRACAGPDEKIVSISEVRYQEPFDEIYLSSPVTYVKLDRLPPVDDTSSIIEALIAGRSFVTSGEVLMPTFEVRGTGNQRNVVADVEWTFPLDMVEIVWGDGVRTNRKVVSTKDLPPLASNASRSRSTQPGRQGSIRRSGCSGKWRTFATYAAGRAITLEDQLLTTTGVPTLKFSSHDEVCAHRLYPVSR